MLGFVGEISKQHDLEEDGGGPIARFESCKGAEELVMGDIACQFFFEYPSIYLENLRRRKN